ncbi:hypothetical protein ACWCXH_37400 [Kitasatospora sp. NPDC001660]
MELAEDDHGFPGRGIAELWEDEGWRGYILTGGTCTVLDFYASIDAEAGDQFAMMRPLTEEEIRSWASHGRPTREQWDASIRRLLDPVGAGIGRCTVLYQMTNQPRSPTGAAPRTRFNAGQTSMRSVKHR